MAARPADTAVRVETADPRIYPQWDREVASLPGTSFFHRSAWARILCDTYGYTPVYLVSHDGDRLTGILPLLEVASWLTGKRGVSLPFTDACGAAARDESTAAELVRQAWIVGQQREWRHCELRSTTGCGSAPPSIAFHGHSLDLTIGAESLLSTIESSGRRALRKAERSELRIEFSRSHAAVLCLHRLLCETRRRHGLPPQPLRFFENLHRHVLASDQGVVVLAWLTGVPVAGALFLHHGRTAVFKYGASLDEHQLLRPNQLVMWRAIEWHANAGFEHLDFGRTDIGHEGLRRFKLSWGATEHTIRYVRYDCRNRQFTSQQNRTSGWHTAMFRHLPLPLSRLIGAALYRHVA